ncbi:hypothetical protein ACQQ2Q_08860 [Agrobacterium sp. ES01]|uniref:hypothetical protein n=1 Tax=Agrobacterium sp. ES01 TaxID=3420714 RepID=UPI003D152414
MSAQQMPFPDRETVASKLSTFNEADESFFRLLLENPTQDEALLAGINLYLDNQSEAKFLNSLKLERCGEWMGNNAPARLQMRLAEVGRSSQHAAFVAFRDGLTKSGGFERAYPKSPL